MLVRDAASPDWEAIWPTFQAVVAAGETYAYPEDLTSEQGAALWLEQPPGHTVVAVERDGQQQTVVGSAKMGPNRPGRGAHIATASFMVAPDHRGEGAGRALGQYAVEWARGAGYRGMTFNAVVETNVAAVGLWRSLGFEVMCRCRAPSTTPCTARSACTSCTCSSDCSTWPNHAGLRPGHPGPQPAGRAADVMSMAGLWVRVRRLALSVLAACAGLLLVAGPAAAATGPVPTFDCAAANGDGTFTYFFGYTLAGSATVTIPVGPDNQFTSSNKFVGQPTSFLAGGHPDSFSVTTSDTSLQWHLDKTNIKVDSSTLCTNVPVVAEAPAALVMPLAAAAPFVVWFLTMRRRARRALRVAG